MIDLDELQELSELKALIQSFRIHFDYPVPSRITEKIESMINKKHQLIQEKFRLKEYALHCCEQANKELKERE